ncbi:MAG: protein-L-isoaspartate(D-aspartate) O-methyltransferase [Desulfobacteraceae bacterium]
MDQKDDEITLAEADRMVQEQLVRRGIRDPRVLAAMRKVPRHRFVEKALEHQAYGDYPIPIGEQQTISQPYMVASMTEILELQGPEKVLEIGTGSGYQAAVLAELATQVFSIERYPSLAARAQQILEELHYFNVHIRVGDGTLGWPEEKPFDGIIVTAGAPSIPQPLINQLADGGRLVIPVGDQFSQTLTRVVKTPKGLKFDYYGGCRFVRLIGRFGWPEEDQRPKGYA